VTAALEVAMPDSRRWTVEDLDALPEDGVRRELIDGVLIVTPSPTASHQTVAARLCVALGNLCPPEFDATQGVEVRIDRRRALIPDVLVITAPAAERNPHWFAPHEVALAVEIVSPSSVSFDRITKPALYAQAGIPSYWRVETAPELVVHCFALDPVSEVYRAAGSFSDVVAVQQPWPIRLPLASLTPRHRAG
jgi:Uma2 family endonuclease